MTRVAQTEILCVYCPPERRGHVRDRMLDLHPNAVHTNHQTGWLVVESPLGEPRSRFIGSAADVRFLLGEEALVRDPSDSSKLVELGVRARAQPSSLDRLDGDFSFVVLGSEGRATAVRSCSGNPRLFGFCYQEVTAVSSRLDWLGRIYPTELKFDPMRLAIELSAMAIAPHFASVLEGITAIPCGHVAHLGPKGERVARYWSLPTEVEHRSAFEIAEVMAPELRAELKRHVDEGTNTAVLLSGGLDSSLLYGFLARETQALDAVTTLPPEQHEAFDREHYFSHLAAAGCRQHSVFTLTPQALVEHLRAAPGDLCPLGMEWFGVGGLNNTPDVVVSGWFADECWGFLRLAECLAPWLPNVRQLVKHAPFKRQLPRFWLDRHRSGRFTFPPACVGYPEVLASQWANQFKGWLASVSWVERPEQPAEKLRLHRYLTDIGGLYAEAASYAGARAIAPFTARKLVELAARSDPHAFFERGLSKVPLRVLAQRTLPSALATRVDKGDWTPATGTVLPTPNVDAIQPLLDTHHLADHPLLALDDVWCLEWLHVLERGRLRVEHERKTIWR